MRGRESVFVSVAGECEASEGQRPVHPGSERGPGWGVFYPETAETPQSPTLVFRSLSLGLLSSSPPARSPLWTSHGHVSLAEAAHAAPTVPRRDIGSGLGSVLPTVYLASSHEQA